MKMLKTVFSLLVLQHIDVSAFPILYVKHGEDAHFSWKYKMREDKLSAPVWIQNQKRENVFWFSNRSTIINEPYKHRIIFTGNAMNKTVQFTLLNTTVSDAGLYSMQYTNGQRKGQELVLFDALDKPEISEIMAPILNETLQLNCSTKHNVILENSTVEMTIKWKINKSEVVVEDRVNMSGSTLTISPILKSDSGKGIICFAYECCNVTTEESMQYHIDVQHGPLDMYLVPNTTAYYLDEGQQLANVTGTVSCNPECRTYWTKEDERSFETWGNVLHLYNIISENYGTYVFHATNNISQATLSLTVHRKEDYAPGKEEKNKIIPIAVSTFSVTTIIAMVCIVCIWKKRQTVINQKSTKMKRSENVSSLNNYDGSYRDNILYVPYEPNLMGPSSTSPNTQRNNEVVELHNTTHESRSATDRKPCPCPRQFKSQKRSNSNADVEKEDMSQIESDIQIYSYPSDIDEETTNIPPRRL